MVANNHHFDPPTHSTRFSPPRLPLQYPLRELVVINRDPQYLEDVRSLQAYVLAEANVAKVILSADRHSYGVQLRADPDFRVLGARLKVRFVGLKNNILFFQGDLKAVTAYLKVHFIFAKKKK